MIVFSLLALSPPGTDCGQIISQLNRTGQIFLLILDSTILLTPCFQAFYFLNQALLESFHSLFPMCTFFVPWPDIYPFGNAFLSGQSHSGSRLALRSPPVHSCGSTTPVRLQFEGTWYNMTSVEKLLHAPLRSCLRVPRSVVTSRKHQRTGAEGAVVVSFGDYREGTTAFYAARAHQ